LGHSKSSVRGRRFFKNLEQRRSVLLVFICRRCPTISRRHAALTGGVMQDRTAFAKSVGPAIFGCETDRVTARHAAGGTSAGYPACETRSYGSCVYSVIVVVSIPWAARPRIFRGSIRAVQIAMPVSPCQSRLGPVYQQAWASRAVCGPSSSASLRGRYRVPESRHPRGTGSLEAGRFSFIAACAGQSRVEGGFFKTVFQIDGPQPHRGAVVRRITAQRSGFCRAIRGKPFTRRFVKRKRIKAARNRSSRLAVSVLAGALAADPGPVSTSQIQDQRQIGGENAPTKPPSYQGSE